MSSIINPARVDFVTLRLFCAVARAGSITKGATACHLALSAASRRLSEFEEAAGCRLFARRPDGISLTPAGHVALQHALRLFHGFERFSSELSDYAQGVRGHVRLWANMSALTEFLPTELASFAQLYPDIRVEVEDELSGAIVGAVVDGVADIGIFGDNTPADGLDARPYRIDELVVFCARAHPLALSGRKRIGFQRCLAYDFIGLQRGTSLLELTSRAAEEAGIPMRLRIQVRSFDAACHMVAANLGLAVLPVAACRVQAEALELVSIRLTDAWAVRKLVIGTKAGVSPSPTTQLLLEHLSSAGG